MSFHRANASGSAVCRLAFIGKAVRGKLTVSFHSGISLTTYYNSSDGRARTYSTERLRGPRGSTRERTAGADSVRTHRATRHRLVLVSRRVTGRDPWADGRVALGRAHELQGDGQYP